MLKRLKRLSMPNLKALALALLTIGLTAGVVFSNLCFQEYVQTIGTAGSSFLRQYADTAASGFSLFFYLLRVRLGIVLVLLVVGMRPWGAVAALVYCVWLGFSGGMVMAMTAMTGGVSELLYLLAMLFPQILVYVPAWCLLYVLILRFSDGRRSAASKKRYRLYALLVVLLFFIGVLLEAYVNPTLLNQIFSVL